MGVTIHYAGRLPAEVEQQEFLTAAEELATQHMWPFKRLDGRPDQPATGITIFSHPECEPLEFAFDQRGRFSSWVKTQFAGPEHHIQVIEFLRQIRPYLGKFGVRDEGEYWATGSAQTLRVHFDTINGIIRDEVEKDPNVRAGVHLPSGRIVDLIQ